jgi:glycerol-3-phosphate dehydrogenase
VIGGGVNGTGIARDAAMRGISTCLVEKKDFAVGSSGANSGMNHGGTRYLLFNAEVTKLSCLDSGYIQRIAPHLLLIDESSCGMTKTSRQSMARQMTP